MPHLSRSNSRFVAGDIGYFVDSGNSNIKNCMVVAMIFIIFKNVIVASTVEAEYETTFLNGQHDVHIATLLLSWDSGQHLSCVINYLPLGLPRTHANSIDKQFQRDTTRPILRGTSVKENVILADYFTKSFPVPESWLSASYTFQADNCLALGVLHEGAPSCFPCALINLRECVK